MSDECKSSITLNLDVNSDNYVEVNAMDEKELCEMCQRMVHPDEAALECVHDECPHFNQFEEHEVIPVDLYMEGLRSVDTVEDTPNTYRSDAEYEED